MAAATLISQPPPPDLALVGTFRFPEHNAECQRIRTIARLFDLAGTRVRIGAADPTPDHLPKPCEDGEFPLVHLSEHPSMGAHLPVKFWRYFFGGGRAVSWLRNAEPRDSSLLMYGVSASFAWRLLRHARRARIPLIIDAMEWFQPSHVAWGALGPFRWSSELAMRVVYPRARNIIAISRYLERHFRAKGCRVLYLPAILDVLAMEPDLAARPDGSPLQLAYTGTPGKKDLLDPMVEALLRLDPGGSRIQFTLAGPSEECLLQLPALQRRGLNRLPACISAMGYVSHQEATALVRRADFTVLLRHPHQRYALAGFPTKVPESLAMGTPLIGNLTSDLGDFLVDGQHALVCGETTPEACQEALERALALGSGQQAAMRHASRALAERAFDYRQYKEPMRDFMCGLELP